MRRRSIAGRALQASLALGLVVLFAIISAFGDVSVAAQSGGAVTGTAPTTPGNSSTNTSTSGPVATDDLTVAAIGSAASAGGFAGTALVIAIAVALAESSGNPAATNVDDNGTVDRGLWQINSVHLSVSDACAYDPDCAASAAYAISDGGTDWEAWTTYQHGAEIAFLPEAIAYVEDLRSAA